MKTSTIVTIRQVLEHEATVQANTLQCAKTKPAEDSFAWEMFAGLFHSTADKAEKNLAEVKAALEDFDAQDWNAAAHEGCKGTCK